MLFIKKDTATTVIVGPLVDATDGFTPETGIGLAAGEADLYKHNSGARLDISGRTFTHVAKGVYTLALLASDVDTLGNLSIHITDTAHRPFRLDAIVLSAHAFDSLCGTGNLSADVRTIVGNDATAFLTGTTMLKTDVTQIGGNAIAGFLTGTAALKADAVRINGVTAAAERHAAAALGIVTGTVGSGSTTTAVVTDLVEATNDHVNSRTVVFTSGALDGQAAQILDYTGATKTLTVTALTEAPASGTTFVIV